MWCVCHSRDFSLIQVYIYEQFKKDKEKIPSRELSYLNRCFYSPYQSPHVRDSKNV